MSEDLAALVAAIAGEAAGGEQIEAYALRSRETEVVVFDGDVESLAVAGVAGVGVRVVIDGRQGFAWAGSLDRALVLAALSDARDNAAFAAPDEANGLPGPDDSGAAADLDLWRDSVLTTPTDEKVALALEMESALRARDPRIRSVPSVGYDDSAFEVALANSRGVRAGARRTVASIHAYAVADDGSGPRTGSGFSAGRSIEELDCERAVDEAATRACRLLGARPIASRRLPVLLDPLVTASFLGLVGAACNGESLLKGRSLFEGRAGEAVAAPVVDLHDDPTDERALGATPHDAEGIACRRNALIAGGVLQGFLHNTYTARRAATASTASAVRAGFKSTPGVGARALALAPGRRSPEAVFASVPEALYVQSVHGLHSGTNPVSGDFSVGADGLMVRNGEFAEPVAEITIASTIPRMLLDITEIANDLTFRAGSAAGVTVLVGEMSLSGT